MLTRQSECDNITMERDEYEATHPLTFRHWREG
jgi:hypothetical protein